MATKTSWGYISYLLKSFYNPELNSGQAEFKQAVSEGLAAGDLFFGLVNALLQTDPPAFHYFKITPQTEYDEKYQRIVKASSHYEETISEINKILGSEEISRFIGDLNQFFQAQHNRVKWIELAENRCAFISMPLDITSLVKNILKPYPAVSFADVLDGKILPSSFCAVWV